MAKQNLPSIYIAEKNEYNRLFDLGLTRTNTGNLTFTSSSSSITYDTSVFAGGAYSNQGQEGMFLILKIVLTDYLIFAEDINDYAGSTGGTSTAYTATLTNWSKVDGALIVVKCHTDQTGVGTLNVNSSGANGLKKPNGADLVNMKSGGIYPFRYSSSGNFILQGSDSAGNATSAQVLATRTCTTDAGDITGTMPDKTGTVETAVSFTGSAGVIDIIPATGFFDGSTAKTRITDPDLVTSNILQTANVFGLQGTAYPWSPTIVNQGTISTNSQITATTSQPASGIYTTPSSYAYADLLTFTGSITNGFMFLAQDPFGGSQNYSSAPFYSGSYNWGFPDSGLEIRSVATSEKIVLDASFLSNGQLIPLSIFCFKLSNTVYYTTMSFQKGSAAYAGSITVSKTLSSNFFAQGIILRSAIGQAYSPSNTFTYVCNYRLYGTLYTF